MSSGRFDGLALRVLAQHDCCGHRASGCHVQAVDCQGVVDGARASDRELVLKVARAIADSLEACSARLSWSKHVGPLGCEKLAGHTGWHRCPCCGATWGKASEPEDG